MTTAAIKTPSKANISDQLKRARFACERICNEYWLARINSDRPRNNQQAFRDLVEAIAKCEREHMAFGARMLGHRPARRSTTATRVAYFVVHLLAVEKHARPDWDALGSMRRDWQIAIALQIAIGRKVFRDAIKAAGCDLALLDTLDYAKDLA